jgi:hypothetical protein
MLAPENRGAKVVGDIFFGRAQAAQAALIDGRAGLVFAPGGQPRAIFGFRIAQGKIVEIDLIADPERIREFEVVLLGD